MNWKLVVLAIGMSLTFWDIFNVPYIINYVSKQFEVSTVIANLPLSAEMIGYAIGGVINGLLSSFKGRKIGLLTSMGLVSLGSLIGFLSQTFSWIIIAEFIIGLGIEGEISVVPAYISETVSAERRGRAVGLVTASGFLTTLIVGPIAVALGGEWRLLFLAGLLVSLIALITRLWLPESPMWIAKKEMKLSWDFGILMMTIVWFLSYFTGYALFSDPIFSFISSHGFTNTALYFTYILYGDPLGVVIGTLLNDNFERKCSVSLVNVLAGVVIVAWFFSSGSLMLIMGFMEMFLQGFKFPTMYAYTAEIFGTRIRTLGYGIADGIGHLGGAIGPIIFSLAYVNMQLLSFIVLAVVAGIAGTIVGIWGIRTTGKPLESIKG
ncbi:MFS transporter [Saccharolobus shibatae]|nr:MFS transporter [Saccharolobus shibatae]